METLRGAVLFVSLLGWACVETPAATDARAAAHAIDQPTHVAVDDFWLDQQIASFEDHPAARPKSISLGYAGDTPLSGGITRDTPIYYGYGNQEQPSYGPDPFSDRNGYAPHGYGPNGYPPSNSCRACGYGPPR
jgi:hypothetical protein